jgi:exopolysaccharide biosynthesis polyprenyl glycosylphosphotransferase
LFEKRPTIIEGFGHIPVISFRQEPLENVLNRFLKRSFDILFSLFVIIFILSWLVPILAIIIKLESKGPLFFVQMRSGKDNAAFKCYKFRSMRVNNDSDKKQASRQDARITKVGAFIRKTNIDELPQFFNVLIGDMSIVGPRPHMLSHTEEYSKLISKFMVRHFLKPGITGWAQVSGYRGETRTIDAMERRVEADVWYLENWSFLLDLKIIFLTMWNTFKGEENAF